MDVFIRLLFTEIQITAEPDIFQILAGFWPEFSGFHRLPSVLL